MLKNLVDEYYKRNKMKALVEIDAGICGFRTQAEVVSNDSQNITFTLNTNCEKIRQLGQTLKSKEPIDVYQEISPAGPAVVMTAVKEVLKGCCSGCVVPAGLFKAMQIAAGLALPKNINISLSKED
jgi:hypothetical protein